MKIRLEVDIELDSGEYEVRFRNIGNPGAGIDADVLQRVSVAVFEKAAAQIRKGTYFGVQKEDKPTPN